MYLAFSPVNGPSAVLRFPFSRRGQGLSERVRFEGDAHLRYSYNLTEQQEQDWTRWAVDVVARCARPRRRTTTEGTIERIKARLQALSGMEWQCVNPHTATRRRRTRRTQRFSYAAQYGTPQPSSNSGTIHSYSYKPTPRFRRSAAEPSGSVRAFYGVELEIDDPQDRRADQYAVPGIAGDLFYCKTDGSLTHGVELVSHPSSEGWWREQGEAVKNMLAALRAANWKSHDARTCGLHIHVSKDAFDGSLHMYRFLHLIYRSPKLSLLVSQRQQSQLDRWASLGPVKRQQLKAKAGLATQAGFNRYEAVNVTSRTLEVRMFNGTLRYDRFMKNLQYIWAAVAFTAEVKNLRKVSAAAFVAWVQKNSTTYPELAAFFAAAPADTAAAAA